MNAERKRMPIVPNGDLECVWMWAGIVTYKLCDCNYECEHCSFDRAMKECDSVPFHGEVGGYKLCRTLFYHSSHTWAGVEEGGHLRIGLDDFGQNILGPIQRISLPKLGARIMEGSIQVRGRGIDVPLCPPAEGYIVEVNKQLLTFPTLMNSYPYDKGWVVLIRPVHLLKNLRQLFYGYQAEEWYRREVSRLGSAIAQVTHLPPSRVGPTMQDGGIPILQILDAIEPNEASKIIRQFFIRNCN